jgi:hypothetical protein
MTFTRTVTSRRNRALRAAACPLVESLEPRTLLAATPTLFTLTGNGVAIANGSKSISAVNGTFLGTVPPGSTTPLTATFTIQGNGTLAFPAFPAITVSGKGSANFTVSQPTLDAGNAATFTVTYNPVGAKAGTNTAQLTVLTNDPAAPAFKFTVGATSSPSVDLFATIGNLRLPAGAIVPGVSKKIQVPVSVTNLGNDKVPSSTAPIDFSLFLRDTTTNVETPVSFTTTPKLRSLSPNHAKQVILFLTVPASVASGSYQLVLKMNTMGALTETDLTNNTVVSSQILTIAQPQYNLTPAIAGSTLPATARAGSKLSGSVTVTVVNNSNMSLKGGQKATVQLFARNNDTNALTLLGSASVSLSKLAPGAAANVLIKLKKALAPATGTYTLVAVVTAPGLAETNTADNTAVSAITLTTT